MTKLLYDSGITIVPGTDALPGFTLHRELELYAQAGITTPEVLRIATLGAARVAHRDKELGSITPGKLADMVLVDGDPVEAHRRSASHRSRDQRRCVLRARCVVQSARHQAVAQPVGRGPPGTRLLDDSFLRYESLEELL